MRHIEPKMVEYLDGKLKDVEIAKIALGINDPRMLFVEALRACVGIREKTGNNDGPMVELIQETIGTADGEAWCMALQQTGIAYAELKTGLISPIFASEGCTEVWENTARSQRVKYNPLPGALAIWKYHGSWKGHTEMVLAADESMFYAVGGNTTTGKLSDGGKIVREGGGVYLTQRYRMKHDLEKELLGFLKPF